ncbi:hypothetical protein EOM33_03195 [Candidatus Saccharibacteria bacterium]|nr:hypothetical protein [Candidatus Saccharibacteria bacterium]
MTKQEIKQLREEQKLFRERYANSMNRYERQILSDLLSVMRDCELNSNIAELAADNLKDKMVEYCYEEDHPNEVALDGVVRCAEQYKMLRDNLERTEASVRDMKNMLIYADIRA